MLGNQQSPIWLVKLIDVFSLHDEFSLLIAVCVGGLLIGIVGGIVSVVYTQLQVGIGQKTVLDLQRDLFEHLQKLSLGYHQKTGTGDAILPANQRCVLRLQYCHKRYFSDDNLLSDLIVDVFDFAQA